MRVALIADIHANLPAFEAVLADINRAAVDQIIFLGDAVYFGPQPHDCLRKLADLGCPCVMGNADTVMLQVAATPEKAGAESRWAFDQLTATDLAFIETFQPTIEIALGDSRTLLCYHGSPGSNTARIEPDISPDHLATHLGGRRTSVLAGGHTHFSMVRPHRGRLVVNPGSVGMPFERPRTKTRDFLLPWAEYGIVTYDEGGGLGVELRQVPYDLDAIKQAARTSQKPAFEHWINDWVVVE